MIFLMGRWKSGASRLPWQRILAIRTYKTVRVMGHQIRKAMAARDADYMLAGLIELDDTYIGAPNQANAAVGPQVNPKSWWRWKLRKINHGLLPCVSYPG
jgi:hypothetical protein